MPLRRCAGRGPRVGKGRFTPMNSEVLIRPTNRLVFVNVPELWAYRDSPSLLVWRDFVAKYQQTILGPIWFLLQPLLPTVVFTLIFGKVVGVSTDVSHQSHRWIPTQNREEPTQNREDHLFLLTDVVCVETHGADLLKYCVAKLSKFGFGDAVMLHCNKGQCETTTLWAGKSLNQAFHV